MRRLILTASAFGLAACLVTGTAAAQSQSVQRNFSQGGTAHLDLSAGEYEITASPDDTIRVVWPGSKDVDVSLSVNGSRAELAIEGPKNDGPHIQVQLPQRTHVVIEMTAGELSLRGIEGSKDVTARAGEVTIGVRDPNQYRRVDASVRIGALTSPAFNVNKGGFFRSFEWNGKGQYDLHAHLTVGDLVLDDE